MKAVISGASGYVGGAIAKAFRCADWSVCPPDLGSGKKWRMPADPDPGSFTGADAFVHAAWDMRPATARDARRTNVEGSRNLLGSAIGCGVRRLVFISSMSAFDGCHSLYGRMKREVERDFLKAGGVVVRPGLVYGANPGGMIGKLLGPVRSLPLLPVPCPDAPQFLVHQETLAGIVLRAGNGELASGVYSVAHPEPVTLRQIVRALAESVHSRPLIIPVPWRIAWLGLKLLGICGARIPFSSDNLVGLAKANTRPDFSPLKNLGIDPPAFPRGPGGGLK